MDVSSTYPGSLDTFPVLINKRTAATTISGEAFTVPSSPYDHVLIETPVSGTLSLAGTPPGGGGSYSLQITPPTASGQVQVNYYSGRLTFHSTDTGGSVSASYDGLGSAQVAERVMKLANMIIAVQTAVGAQPYPTGYTSLKDYLDAELNNLLAMATDPVSQGFLIGGGACFIDRHTRVTLADTAIDLTTGTFQFPATTAAYYRRAMFTLDDTGTVRVYWTAEAATTGGLDIPRHIIDEYPICYVTVQDDGTGGTPGTCEDIDPGDITDMRHVQTLEFDPDFRGLVVEVEEIPSTDLALKGGTFYYVSKTGVVDEYDIADDVLGLGTGGSHEVPAMTATHWNAVLVYIDSTGTVQTRVGTSAAAKGSVVLPTIADYDELGVAVVYVQDDGTGTAGTIENILQTDIHLLLPQRFVFEEPDDVLPTVEIADLEDLLTVAQSTPDKTVDVNAGTLIPYTGAQRVAYAGVTIDFGTGTYQKTVTGTNWMPVIVTLDRTMTTIQTYNGSMSASKGAATLPRFPDDVIVLSLVWVQGDGTGAPGGINAITSADIEDLRDTLRYRRFDLALNVPRVTQDRLASTNVYIRQGWMFFDYGAIYKMSGDLLFDVAGALVHSMTAGNYKYVLLLSDGVGNLSIVEPATDHATIGGAPIPELSTTQRNLAYILIKDSGGGGVGNIINITESVIYNIQEPVVARHHVESWFAVVANTNYTVTHNLSRIPKGVTVLWQSTASGGIETATDISLVPGLAFLNSGVSIIEMSTTIIKVRTATYVHGYYNASGTLQQPTTGYLKVIVW